MKYREVKVELARLGVRITHWEGRYRVVPINETEAHAQYKRTLTEALDVGRSMGEMVSVSPKGHQPVSVRVL